MKYRSAYHDLWKGTKLVASFHTKPCNPLGFDEDVLLTEGEMKKEIAFVARACNNYQALLDACRHVELSLADQSEETFAAELEVLREAINAPEAPCPTL